MTGESITHFNVPEDSGTVRSVWVESETHRTAEICAELRESPLYEQICGRPSECHLAIAVGRYIPVSDDVPRYRLQVAKAALDVIALEQATSADRVNKETDGRLRLLNAVALVASAASPKLKARHLAGEDFVDGFPV